MRRLNFIILFVLFSPLLLVSSCSDKNPALPEEQRMSSLELLPLALGTRWRYRYFHFSEDYQVNTLGSQRTIERLFGELDLEVTDEEANFFFGSYHLVALFSPDSLLTEIYYRAGKDTSFTNYELPQSRLEYDLVLDRDTLWYESGGVREYMMPRSFNPGGAVNLKLFDLPGKKLFEARLGSAQEVNKDEFLYHAITPEIDIVVRILRNVGVKGLIVEKAVGDKTLESNWHEEDLIYNLLLKDPGEIYEVPGRTYW